MKIAAAALWATTIAVSSADEGATIAVSDAVMGGAGRKGERADKQMVRARKDGSESPAPYHGPTATETKYPTYYPTTNYPTIPTRKGSAAKGDPASKCEEKVKGWRYDEDVAEKCFLPVPENFANDRRSNKCLHINEDVLGLIDQELDANMSNHSVTCEWAIANGRGQTPVDVTCGSQGSLAPWGDNKPITEPNLAETSLKPVNVHFHKGAEHVSQGEYDVDYPDHTGKKCHFYDEADKRYNPALSNFQWKHCVGVEVGETYEFHWPRSAVGTDEAGLQYQGKFPDGLLCEANMGTIDAIRDDVQNLANTLGVQAQVFTVIDDDSGAYDIDPQELMAGMIVNEDRGAKGTPKMMGKLITAFTGSRTGDSYGSTKCDPISPVTWHVDRTCHLLSARSMDAACRAITELGRGMIRCHEKCLDFPLRAVFRNPDADDAPDDEEFCCYGYTKPGACRDVNDEGAANANRVHFVKGGGMIEGGVGRDACEPIAAVE